MRFTFGNKLQKDRVRNSSASFVPATFRNKLQKGRVQNIIKWVKSKLKNRPKTLIYLKVFLFLTLIFIFFLLIKNVFRAPSVIGPVGKFVEQIRKEKYEQKEVLRIEFTDEVTDLQAQELMQEWRSLANVTGSSFYATQISGKPLVDLFLADEKYKADLKKEIEKNSQVKVIRD